MAVAATQKYTGKGVTRRKNGTFTKGSAGGPGNPMIARTVEFRRQVLCCVTALEFRKLMRKMYELAMKGDIGAAKIFIDRVLGRVPLAEEDGGQVDYNPDERFL